MASKTVKINDDISLVIYEGTNQIRVIDNSTGKAYVLKSDAIVDNDLNISSFDTPTSSFNLGAVSESIIPDTDVTYDLGSATNRFKDLYLSGNTINLGGTTISSQGGNFIVGQSAGTISSLSTTGMFDYALGPYTTGISIISSLDYGNLSEPGYRAPTFTPTLSGDSVTGITSLDDGGIYPFDGAGDNYFLAIGPADPENEPYVINTAASRIGETVPSAETTLHPNGAPVIYLATHTDVSGETLTVQYELSRNQFGYAQMTILSASQTGPFTADTKWTEQQSAWLALDSDPTTLVWGPVAPGAGPFSAVPIYLSSNTYYDSPLVGGDPIETIISSTTIPQGQTASTLQVSQIINLGVSTAPPASPVIGDIAIADGVLWDPVTTGKLTLVIYLGSWVQIAVAP